MNHKTILYTVIALVLSSSIFFFGYKKSSDPQEVYRVYLDGNSIGLIYSKDELEQYIDSGENAIKEKYNVDKVYIPNNLKIVKEVTYNEKIESASSIYEQIREQASFTIKGYKITIKGVEEMTEEGTVKNDDIVINVLDKQVFIDSVNNTIKAFIDEESYDKFINNTQDPIKNTGTLIEDIYVQNDIVIKEANVSIKDQIFLNSDDLSKYLLFGTLDEQQKYTIQPGDTIESVSFNNRLSIGEFLIANEQFTSASNLLYPGQEVSLGLIQPAVKVVEEKYVVTIEDNAYTTIYEDDNTLAMGTEIIKQKGENGTSRVTKIIKEVNGEIREALPVSEEKIKPVVTQIVVRGQKYVSGVGSLRNWHWPTAPNYVISSPYGWRWGKLHQGIDISGTGYGSPIYAVSNGVVEVAKLNDSINGNYIHINHNNGYYTEYAHMADLNVQEGQTVEAGQLIGTMGATGYAFGVHLHFAVYYGRPHIGTSINPLQFF